MGIKSSRKLSKVWINLLYPAFSLINGPFKGIPTFCFLMIHSLRAFSICSCWPALIFFDFFNAPGLKSTVFIHSLYFSKIIEMAEQLIPYLSMVIFLSTKTCSFWVFYDSQFLLICFLWGVRGAITYKYLFHKKCKRIWLFPGVYFQTQIY